MTVRTDLAMEAHALWKRRAAAQSALSGVRAQTRERDGFSVTTVEILDDAGESALGKPVGRYVTLGLAAHERHAPDRFTGAVLALADELRSFLPPAGEVLVVGLGNEAVTPDAIGPLALQSLLVTRHLGCADGALAGLRSVCAVQPGVLGTTGIESAEIVRGIAARVKPEVIVVIDALASGEPERLCAAVQLTDAGIVPGSGVGNSRAAFDRKTLGVPVLAVGVPTVMDASALAQTGGLGDLTNALDTMMLTPRDIDAQVREMGRLIGYALDLALHDGLTPEELPYFFS